MGGYEMNHNRMRMLLGATMLVLVAVCIFSASFESHASGQEAPGEDQGKTAVFPDSWHGIWRGTCKATRPDGKGYSFAMELHILPLDSEDRRTWKLIYGQGDRRQVRDYELIIRDATKGDYVIDEKNSIMIDTTLLGERFCSQYSVNDSLLTVTYTRDNDCIEFYLLSSGLDDPALSGNEGDIPEVKTYTIETAQTALLKRQ